MTPAWGGHQRDRLLAALAFVFGVAYAMAARGIEDSLLADEVGAGGVPQAVGVAMALAALALFVKSFRADAGKAPAAADEAAAEQAGLPWRSVALRTAGLVALLLGYGALLPLLGYPITISLLIAAAGALAGAPLRWPLLACALLGGPLLWGLFDLLLQVRMPRGVFGF